ncbi:ATP-grasp domain-containing protein [Kalamiella sp. sgz302252]|uniref:ATP-grasp domain-containing protein n=1 Tax=Pantoea sp. sgz302252 TaxID=3341827 RepID=UPI0036D34F4E
MDNTNQSAVALQRFAVIVDPFSSGALLAEEFKKRGLECIALISQKTIPAVFAGSYRRDDFFMEIRFDGDAKKIARALSRLNIQAVVSCLETSVALADRIADLLDVPGNNVFTSDRRRDKFAMGEAVRAAGLRAPLQKMSASADEILRWVEEHKVFPVVVKPVNSAGSDSVTICNDLDEVKYACSLILGKLNKFEQENAFALVQEFLDGPEYVVDTVTLDGQTVTCNVFVYDKVAANNVAFVYRAIRALELDDPVAKKLIAYNDKVLKALDIHQGAGHSEIIISNGEPVLVEVGARMHGGNIPAVVQKCAKWSQIELLVDSYVDRASFYRRANEPLQLDKKILIHFYISGEGGELKAIRGQTVVENMPSYFDAFWYVKPGEAIAETVDLYTCPLKVILTHDDVQQIEKDKELLLKLEEEKLMFEV